MHVLQEHSGFLCTLLAKMMKKFPHNEPVLKNLGILCPTEKLVHTAESGKCGVFISYILVRLLCVSFSGR